MDDETTGIDAQAYGIADEGERHKRQQYSQHQQNDTDTAEVGIDTVHQVLHIGQVTHTVVLPDLLGYPLQRVTVSIIGSQLDFQSGREWVKAQKLSGITAQLLDLLTLSLLLTDIIDVVGIRPMVQVTTQQVGVVDRHTILQHDGHGQMFLHVSRQVSCRQDKEHHQAQQDEHHRGAYT